LSCGDRTRAGSTKIALLSVYSANARCFTGSVALAFTIMLVALSRTIRFGIPPKKRHAASRPSITSRAVWDKHGQTNMWRLALSTTMST